MFVMGNLVMTLAEIIDLVLKIYYWIIIIRALISWVSPDPFNPIVQFINRVTEPVLEPIRRILPQLPLDISPLIACFAVYFLRIFLSQTLFELAARLKAA